MAHSVLSGETKNHQDFFPWEIKETFACFSKYPFHLETYLLFFEPEHRGPDSAFSHTQLMDFTGAAQMQLRVECALVYLVAWEHEESLFTKGETFKGTKGS